MSSITPITNLGLFFGIIQHDNPKKKPTIIWSASTWHSEIQTWDLVLEILAIKDNLEDVEWNFLPLIWDEVEIFALSKAFQIIGIGTAYLVIFHQSAEKLTEFILMKEEEIARTFVEIFSSSPLYSNQRLTNEQLKQIRIKSQSYYEILSQI